ncbi:MAG: hypothetical protein IPJ19_10825 [Planctomycetes bacterium]|nr:hypothetical protein [Planctomycetota bacterium]
MNTTHLETSPRPESMLHTQSRLRSLGAALTPAAIAALGLFMGGCGSGNPAPVTSGFSTGSIVDQPDPSIGSRTFVVDANSGGQAGSVKLKQLLWGRLVNVRDSLGELQNTDMVVGEDIRTDGIDFVLDVNPITEETTVTIQHEAGTQAYIAAFQRLDQNLTPTLDKSLDPSELPPFSLLPRNSALVLKFDDLIDNSTIKQIDVRLVVGYPAATPFDFRIIPDINHGDLYDADHDGTLEFHTTRVILDTTVSSVEAGASNPPLPINNLGLPASVNTSQANIGVRIPTLRDNTIGQTTILTNLAGNGLSFGNNGSNDSSISTLDIVRAMRSGGGASGASIDPNNGFLIDEIPPRIVGVQAVTVSTPTGVADDYITTIDYVLDTCALRPKVGDVIQQPGVFAEVVSAPNGSVGGTVADVHFRVVFPLGGHLAAGPSQIFTLWNPVSDFGKEGCFVRYSSTAPGGTAPGQGVSSDARVIVRFSEPMDPTTLTAFDNMPLLRVDPSTNTPTARDYVIGEVDRSPDLKEYSFTPVINFKHTIGSSNDRYWLNVASGAVGPVDLAGNPIGDALPTVSFTIDPADATELNGGLVFRFSSQDELNNDGKPEWRGQIAPDLTNGRVGPRPVTRTRATCDRTIPIPTGMATFPQGLQTPLSGLGSKLQTLWRYCDVGYALIDESTYNVDVEHLYWAPAGGNVVADAFDQFEVRLSHTKCLPDESIDPASLWPYYPNSGLSDVFASNLLDATLDPQRVVHDKSLGYIVSPADKKPASTNAEQVMPYPLNWGIPTSQYQYYTWRDTALLAKGAIGQAPGAELRIVCRIIYGIDSPACFACPYTNFNGSNPAPSIALPLLMEFRCYPDTGALGLNSLDVNFAINSSAKPNFRAYSTGGNNGSGTHFVDPDNESAAHGGYNPTSVPPGATTLRFDNTVYLGEMDLVLRISRMHSIWLDSQLSNPTYLPPVIEPRDSDQPTGTSIVLDYRGATSMNPAQNANIATDATFLDMYGNPTLCPVNNPPPNTCPVALCSTNGIPSFLANNSNWRSSISMLNGAPGSSRLFQVRVTFISNTDTNLSPSLSALGFAFRQ